MGAFADTDPLTGLRATFAQVVPTADFVSLRAVRTREEVVSVRRGILQPLRRTQDLGAMVTVVREAGVGYAATADLSLSGLRGAMAQACQWADLTAGYTVTDFSKVPFGDPKGEYRSPVERPWEGMALADRIDRAISWAQRLPVDARIVDWEVTLWNITQESLYLTAGGGEVWQSGAFLIPQIEVSANDGRDTATRSLAGRGFCQQGGLEVLDRADMDGACERVPREALELLSAPQCPTQTCDLILAPDQMILQIHESIGHPLELDRILGDERNYAGTSFVTEDMFGSYRYGSDLLNVTFDPTVENELASYRFDDDGTPAQRAHLIRDGILERPLGGVVSQTRAQMPGVANSRATNWNRPAMDRMANINLEHGESTLQELISSVENGVYMETNNSWSIDDSRNKFQFGCEYGRAIRDGELRDVVRNPNYRGVSATFWRSLAGVGSRDTVGVLGSPFCGKGEPNQVIRVGHSSPTCLFRNVEVFGGAA